MPPPVLLADLDGMRRINLQTHLEVITGASRTRSGKDQAPLLLILVWKSALMVIRLDEDIKGRIT